MTGRPRITVVGAGLVGRRHAELAARHACLDAIVDPNRAAAKLAESLGAKWFADLDDCLGRDRMDGAIIATPNQLHAANALACLGAGVPVLVEKPIADNTADGARLVEAAGQAGVPLLVGHHRRHNPLVSAAKEALDAGRIGPVTAVNAQFWLYKPDDYYAEAWRRRKGAGPIFINSIHDIDLLRYLCGEIAQVEARRSKVARGLEVEDTAAILLEFASGALGTVSVSDTIVSPWSWEFTAGENPAYPKTDASCYRIGGTRGALSIPDLRLWSQPEGRDWWKPITNETLPFKSADPFARQFAHFLDVIAGCTNPMVSGEDGLRTLGVMEAIVLAAESGCAMVPNADHGAMERT